MNNQFPIVEIFKSIEGEGIRMGIPTTFVRFGGCNLTCNYCDTKYAQDNYTHSELLTREEIYTRILSQGLDDITFTGGEPLLHGHEFIDWFISKDEHKNLRINIETNGTQNFEEFQDDNVFITMDWKSPSSGMRKYMDMNLLRALRNKDILKFVVGTKEDLHDVVATLLDYRPRCHIFVNPIFGQIELSGLAEFIVRHAHLKLRMGIQLHKIIWDPETRGV